MQETILIAGCGFIGAKVGGRELAAGHKVYGIVRSPSSGEKNTALGLTSIVVNFDQPELQQLRSLSLLAIDRLYYFLPPAAHGVVDSRIDWFLNQLPPKSNIQSALLISTTGVYGNCAGDWVNEKRIPAPSTERAKRRLYAENSFRSWAVQYSKYSVVLRVPGIYSRERLPLKRLHAQTPVLVPEQSPFSNRIHADDLAEICYRAIRAELRDEVLNVSDDAPSTMTEFFFAVADAMGLARPPILDRNAADKVLSAEMLDYLAESRRIDNSKMKHMLKYKLRYPSLLEGLGCANRSEDYKRDE